MELIKHEKTVLREVFKKIYEHLDLMLQDANTRRELITNLRALEDKADHLFSNELIAESMRSMEISEENFRREFEIAEKYRDDFIFYRTTCSCALEKIEEMNRDTASQTTSASTSQPTR